MISTLKAHQAGYQRLVNEAVKSEKESRHDIMIKTINDISIILEKYMEKELQLNKCIIIGFDNPNYTEAKTAGLIKINED